VYRHRAFEFGLHLGGGRLFAACAKRIDDQYAAPAKAIREILRAEDVVPILSGHRLRTSMTPFQEAVVELRKT